jgi:hypothetical protein
MAESDDLRTFIREIMARFDRGFEQTLARMDRRFEQAAEERRRYFEQLDRKADEDAERTRQIVAESRAQREALFRILDKMDNGGTAPAG